MAPCPLDGTIVNVTSRSVIRAMLTGKFHQFQMCHRRSFGSSSRVVRPSLQIPKIVTKKTCRGCTFTPARKTAPPRP
eukprot:scaffold8566_cov621-Pinguiococcus_pyrenoidosus.AAC.1